MAERMAFTEPRRKHELGFTVAPVRDLDVVPFQRKPSQPHVKRVAGSIDRIGFLVPLVAVEEDGRLMVIDGQHRLLAAKELGLKELPVVVVPRETATRMMHLNVEKDPNIRERAYVALAVYTHLVSESPSTKEDSPDVDDAVSPIHLVSLGLAYEEAARLSGSAFEPILKRCDLPLPDPLERAIETRRARAGRLLEADKLVKSITKKVKEQGVDNPYLTAQIMAYANPFGRTRKKDASFDDTFQTVLGKLAKLEDEPGRLLK